MSVSIAQVKYRPTARVSPRLLGIHPQGGGSPTSLDNRARPSEPLRRLVSYGLAAGAVAVGLAWVVATGSTGAVAVVFFSVVWESLPFLLVGTILSLFVEERIPRAWFARLFGRGGPRSLLVASLVGLVLPLCDCGIIPLVRGLLQRKVRPSVAATAYLSIPLVNPIVIGSTFYAFRDHPDLALLRFLGGWLVVVAIGHILWAAERWVFRGLNTKTSHEEECEHDHSPERGRWSSGATHLSADLYATGRYLVIGALVSAVFQTSLGATKAWPDTPWVVGIGLAMGLAFVLSLCSTSDALVGRSLLGSFSAPAVVAFLLVGPLLHLRSLILLRRVFPPRTLAILGTLVIVGVASFAAAIHLPWGGRVP